ncbi:MAG: hypothetical protein ACRD04_06345 [Terriglobales bacterium]
MPKGIHSTAIIVIVFVLGLAAGIVGMIYAGPGLHAHFAHPRHRVDPLQSELHLTPQQINQVHGVFKDAGQVRHQIHLQYQAEYENLCEQYATVRKQEHDSYMQSPDRQKLLNELHGIMTGSQWTEWQKLVSQHHPHTITCGHPQHAAAGHPTGKH